MGRADAASSAHQIEHELKLIAELGFAGFFLVMADAVRFARHKGILCQGRGSAANSAVAFCLGITAVDPVKHGLVVRALSVGGARRRQVPSRRTSTSTSSTTVARKCSTTCTPTTTASTRRSRR